MITTINFVFKTICSWRSTFQLKNSFKLFYATQKYSGCIKNDWSKIRASKKSLCLLRAGVVPFGSRKEVPLTLELSFKGVREVKLHCFQNPLRRCHIGDTMPSFNEFKFSSGCVSCGSFCDWASDEVASSSISHAI